MECVPVAMSPVADVRLFDAETIQDSGYVERQFWEVRRVIGKNDGEVDTQHTGSWLKQK